MITEPFSSVGVVPIFVNAGASIAPLIIGSLTTFFAILLKPKELLSLFRRKPWVPVAILGGGVGIWFLGVHLFSTSAAAASTTAPSTTGRRVRRAAVRATAGAAPRRATTDSARNSPRS